MDVHIYLHGEDLLAKVMAGLEVLSLQGKLIMATTEEVLVLERANATRFTDYIAKRDAVDADLLAKIAELTAKTGVATQAQIDELFALATAEKATFAPAVVPPPDPVPPPEPATPN